MRRLPVALALVLAGCASTHDLAQGPNVWGGGVYRERIQDGLHYIVVKSNVAPWTNREAVSSQWQTEASKLCSGGHRALHVEDSVEEEHAPMTLPGLSLRYLVTVRTGYALCDTATLDPEDAARIIDQRR